jgi:hypothetical protein
MAIITNLSIPYPDFKLHEVIDPEQFDFNNGAILDKVNAVLLVLNQITDAVAVGGSGADKISITPIAPFTSTKLQAYLLEVISRLVSSSSGSSGAGFIGSPAIVGVTGLTVSTQLNSIKSLLDAVKVTSDTNTTTMVNHKLSADHDFRYYTEAEMDNTLAILKGAGYSGDTLVGLKTLITGLQTQISNLNTTYSTDAERISAVNSAIAQFQLADGELTTLINNKANVADVYTKGQTDAKVWNTSNIADRAITSIKMALQGVKNEHIEDFSITADKFHPDLLEDASSAVLAGRIGDMSTLQTVAKDSLVNSLNEIKASLDSIATTGISTSITDAGSYYTATHVEGALQEIGLAFAGTRTSLVTSANNLLGG